MSAAAPLRRPAALRLPATAPARSKPAASTRPRLVLVSQRRPTAGRLPFLIVVGTVLVVGLVGVLFLHMMAAQDAYRANALQQKLAALSDQEQQLQSVVEADSSPAALKAQAIALGMKPTTVGHFHKLHDGRAVGVQTAVVTYVPPPTTIATATQSDSTTPTDSTTKTDSTSKTDSTKSGAAKAGTTTTAGDPTTKHQAKSTHP